MKKPVIVSIVTFVVLLSSCKKDYTCNCTDPKIDTRGFTIHDTKRNAEKTCAATKNPYNDSKCILMKE